MLLIFLYIGSSSTPGPNAPLGNLCGTSKQPQASAEAAYAQWTAAGFPANKMLLGLPLYGYVSQSTATTLTGIAIPPPGFNVQKYRERVLGLPTRNPVPMCPLVREAFEEEPNFLDGKHDRTKQMEKRIEAKATGDLSSYFGQQIAFNQIVALGALTRSNNVYVQANGYTEGMMRSSCTRDTNPRSPLVGWDDCSDTPVSIRGMRIIWNPLSSCISVLV
jgi:chitinase